MYYHYGIICRKCGKAALFMNKLPDGSGILSLEHVYYNPSSSVNMESPNLKCQWCKSRIRKKQVSYENICMFDFNGHYLRKYEH